MNTLKHAFVLALTGSLAGLSTARASISDYVDGPSSIPLAILVVAAIVVYLSNRPRGIMVYARAKRRTDSHRHSR